MKIHHLRNATCVIEAAGLRILVDPMLSGSGELPPFSFMRFKIKRNPTVELPVNAKEALENISHCVITHSHTYGVRALQHTDHLDLKGETFLKENNVAVICRSGDGDYLEKLGLSVDNRLEYWQEESFAGGKIVTVPAKHGHGWNHKLMANGAGFFLELPGEPSLYIAGDTVFTDEVKRALTEYTPEVAIAPAGAAQLDIGPPILMDLDEIIRFVRQAPGKVVLNHLEALNHCPTTRARLRVTLSQQGLLEKCFVPDDGEVITL